MTLGAVAGARRRTETMEVEIDFSTKSDGVLPSTFDTGQAAVRTWNPNSNADPRTVGGKYVINIVASVCAGYYTTDELLDDGDVTYMEGEFQKTGSGTDNWNFAMVAWDFQMPSGSLGGISAQNSPCHLVFTDTNWQYGYYNNTGLHVIQSRTYSPTVDHTIPHVVSVLIDAANDTATVTGTDGVPVTLTPNSNIGNYAGNYACCEIYYGSSTDKRVEILNKFKATSAPGGP